MNKTDALSKISRLVSLISEAAELLEESLNESEKVLGYEIIDLMRVENSEIKTCCFLLNEVIDGSEKSRSIFPVPEDENNSVSVKIN